MLTSIEDWKLRLKFYSVHIKWRPQTANIVRWLEIESSNPAVNINRRLKIEIEIVQCTHYMKAANCKHCPLIWNWISKVIAAEGEHKASRSVMNIVNL